MTQDIGLVLGSAVPPEQLASAARQAEDAGFRTLWLAEDFFLTGGVSSSTIALAATSEITVGLGVVSALVRQPALLAMEISTIARAFPGRFSPGIGLGVPGWMHQMALMPKSPLAAVRDCVTVVRRLLRGETVTGQYSTFSLDAVQLAYPLQTPPPLSLGVIGPKMLELSGSVADGSILSVAAGTEYVQWARQRIDAGRVTADRGDEHGMTTFAIFAVDEDGDAARAAARQTLAFYKAAGGRNALTDAAGISDPLLEMLSRGGAEVVENEMPEEWVDRLTIAGTPSEVIPKIEALLEAGSDSVALFPSPGDRASEIIELARTKVLPHLT